MEALALEGAWTGQLLLDAGDLFQSRYKVQEARWDDVEATADFIIDRYNDSGVGAVAIGDRDTVLGLTKLRKLEERAKFPFLAANLIDARTGEPMFSERTILKVDGIAFGVFGVTMRSAARKDPFTGDTPWRVKDSLETAREQVAALKAEGAQIILALAHLADGELKAIADGVDGIHAILGGNGVTMMHHPTMTSGTYITGAHTRGKYLSSMMFNVWEGSDLTGTFVDRNKRSGYARRIEQAETRIANYEGLVQKGLEDQQKASEVAATQGKAALPRQATANLDFYKKQVTRYKAEKQMLELELEELASVDPMADFITYELVAVDKALVQNPEVGELVREFRKKVKKL